MKKIVIIGAGIGGLSAAYSLEEEAKKCGEKVEITLIERRERLGGNIRSERVGDFLVEAGPDCFLSEKPWAMELCKRIGIGDKIITTNDKDKKTFVLSGGKLHELPEGVILMVPTKILPLVYSRLFTLRGKIRMGLEMFIPKKKGDEDETLGSFVTRRLGKEMLDKIAEPLVAGVHAGNPDTMSVKASFPKFVQMEKDYGSLIRGMIAKMGQMAKAKKPASSGAAKPGAKRMTMFITLRDGLSEMVETVVSKLEMTSIRTGENVAGVKKADGGYEVDIEGGEKLECDALVIAAPAYAAANLVGGMDKDLSELLLTIPYVSTATVSLGYKKKDIPHPLNGFGFVVPKIEGRRIMASSWVSVKFSHRAPDDSVLIRCFVGGSKNEKLVHLGDEELEQLVKEELRDILGVEKEPIFTRIFRWNKAMPQYTIGHEERVASIDEKVASHKGLYLTGSAYHGIGISDCIRLGEETSKEVMKLFGYSA